MRHDESAASPLTVILVFVGIAVAVTAVAFLLFDEDAPPSMQVQHVERAGSRWFEVTDVQGDFAWSGLQVRFLDGAGVDQADTYLQVPQGTVEPGDQIRYQARPPAGTYLLRLLDGQREVARVAVSL